MQIKKVDCFVRGVYGIRSTGFNLDKHDRFVFSRNNIDFSPVTGIVGIQNSISVILQKLFCELFSSLAGGLRLVHAFYCTAYGEAADLKVPV